MSTIENRWARNPEVAENPAIEENPRAGYKRFRKAGRMSSWPYENLLVTFSIQRHPDYDRKITEHTVITGARDVFRIMHGAGENAQERFYVLLLNARNQVVGIVDVFRGTIASVEVTPNLVFAPALAANARSIILVHNHPSGDAEPSVEDERLTNRLAAAGHTLDITVLDHVVIGHDSYVSLGDRGVL